MFCLLLNSVYAIHTLFVIVVVFPLPSLYKEKINTKFFVIILADREVSIFHFLLQNFKNEVVSAHS